MNKRPAGPADGSDPAPADIGKSPREYGHSSGDRNTKSDEDDWPELRGGSQRDATPDAPATGPSAPVDPS